MVQYGARLSHIHHKLFVRGPIRALEPLCSHQVFLSGELLNTRVGLLHLPKEWRRREHRLDRF